MLGKRTRPAIGKLPDMEKNNRFSSDGMASPKSPLDLNTRSPRGLKNSNLGGGVGLGIVAALDKSDSAHVPIKFVVGNLNLNRSDPIPIGSGAKGSVKCRENIQIQKPEVPEMGCWDEYTCVTSHQPNNTFTKVYFDGGEDFLFDPWMNSGTLRRSSSPPRFEEFPTSDFLSSCHLCRKKLDGKDIYMYRGEKAFCSTECRYRQIISDERKEKCKSEVSRSMDMSVSPYSGGQLFSTGIFAV